MDIRILSPLEVYRKAKIASDELVSKSKHFAMEQISTNAKSIGGYMRRFIRQKTGSDAFVLGGDSFAALALATDPVLNGSSSFAQSTFNHTALKGVLAVAFMGSTDVTENVYNELHQLDAVQEFNKQIALVEHAYDPTFKGELPTELAAFRDGKTFGPLKHEFDAHVKLAQEGIRFIRQDDQQAFAFSTDVLKDIHQKLNEPHKDFNAANSLGSDKTCHVLVFKECAAPHRSEHLSPAEKKHAKAAAEMVLVPKGEALAYVPQ